MSDNTHPSNPNLDLAYATAKVLCEGFGISHAAPPVDSDAPDPLDFQDDHIVLTVNSEFFTDVKFTLHANGWVTFPPADALPAEVIAAIDLDLRAFWADRDITPTDPTA